MLLLNIYDSDTVSVFLSNRYEFSVLFCKEIFSFPNKKAAGPLIHIKRFSIYDA